MNKEFIEALEDLEKEKGISKKLILEATEKALVAAYKGKNKDGDIIVDISIDPDNGDIAMQKLKYVVETVTDSNTEVSLEEVLEYDPDFVVGDQVGYPIEIEEFGRIAAQTAKQVVVQTLREEERSMIFDEYIGRQSELITGTIQRVSNETVFANLGRTEGILSYNEQVRGERYTVNNRLKFYIMDVRKSQKGPQVFLSRSHPGLVKRLFELEVPEIQDGIIVIESIAREAGSRSKLAVSSSDESVDPVGACVGNRGTRVQAVVDELFGEKIDIITWTDSFEDNISSALSPSKVEKIILDEAGKAATAVVPDYQLSLAIGKEGQNVRLAAKLCGVKIDIKSHSQYYGSSEDNLAGALDEEGYLNPADFMDDPEEEIEIEEAAESEETAIEDDAAAESEPAVIDDIAEETEPEQEPEEVAETNE